MTREPPKLRGPEKQPSSQGTDSSRPLFQFYPDSPRKPIESAWGRKGGGSGSGHSGGSSGGGGKNPPNKSSKKKRKSGRSSIKWVIFKLFLTIGIWVLCFGGLATLWFSYDLPDIRHLQATTRRPGVVVMTQDGTVIGTYGDLYEDMIRINELPPYVPQALMAIEDRRFYMHFGVDIIGLIRAAYTNYKADRVVQGGSTITQQLAKNFLMTQGLYGPQDRSFRRKIQEAIMAVWLEWHFSKDQIMTIYLNRVYFGAGAFGIDAAAHKHFNKSARQLSVYEAAAVMGLLKAPSRYSPTANPGRSRARTRVVLNQMQEAGYIRSADEYMAQADAQQTNQTAQHGYRFFADWVYDTLSNYVSVTDKDMVVVTTLDLSMQRKAEEAAISLLNEQGKGFGTSEIALVAMTPNGAVRAMVGGKNFQGSQFNRVTQALRQPGSAWKPFVYLAALESGMTPSTRISDEPITINGWTTRNFGKHQFRYLEGEDFSLEDAITKSINTCTVRIGYQVGVRKVAEVARRLGITSKIVMDPSMLIGTTGVTLLELTAAIGTFANNGVGVWPYGILIVKDKSGNTLYQRESESPSPVVESRYVKQMNQLLTSVVNRGTGRAAKMPFPVGGKTGSNGDLDAWFVGYTADLVAGVWTGNDNNALMNKTSTGGKLPARVWAKFIKSVYGEEGQPEKELGAELPVDDGNHAIREDSDEISENGPLSPVTPQYGNETDDEFERLVNQVADS